MGVPPLGALDAFAKFASAKAWGPDQTGKVAFGGRVVLDGLIAGFRAHPAAVARRFSARAEAYPLVLGCVPWLDSPDVVDAILAIGSCCVIVDKGIRNHDQCERLLANAEGVPMKLLRELATWGPPENGRRPVIGPPGLEDRDLEPVRVAGWKLAKNTPLLHAKLAVCCAAWRWENDFGGWDDLLTPISVWLGSANWTQYSRSHLEVGLWSSDQSLMEAAVEFIMAVVKISEPFGAGPGGPQPQFVEGEWDDAAMAEALSALTDFDLGDSDEA